MLFDHDAKVSGDSARFTDFVAAGGQQLWGGLCAEGLSRLGYRSVTHRKVTRPAGWRLGAMLFPGDRAVLAPYCDFRTIRLRQIAEDHTIGNLVAERRLARAGPPNGTWTESQIVRPVQACGIRGRAPLPLCSDRLRPVTEDRPHFYGVWCTWWGVVTVGDPGAQFSSAIFLSKS